MSKLVRKEKQIPLLGIHIESFDSWDFESIVKNFWMHSLTFRMNEFDFSGAFGFFEDGIKRKLNEHAQLSYEQFRDGDEDYGYHSDEDYEKFTSGSDWFSIDIDDVKEAISKMRYEKLSDVFSGVFSDLEDINDKLEGYKGHTLEWKIITFDECIHSEHQNGFVFEEADNLDDYRSDTDKLFIELKEEAKENL